MSTQSDLIIIDQRDNVLTLTINNPERRNAISPEARGILNRELVRASKDRTIGVIVITGAGDQALLRRRCPAGARIGTGRPGR